MKTPLHFVCTFLLAGCTHSTTSVRISDGNHTPISGFPLRFELDQGLKQTDPLGVSRPVSNPNGLLFEGTLTKLDERTFGTRTNSQGMASISYVFKERQPAAWKIWLLNAPELPDQNVDIIPLQDLPSGSRISVATPNP